MKRNLLYILGVVCLMTSCVEENFENHGLSSMAGKEVVFSADMNDGPVTRTNYGDPVTNTSGTTTAFKVNWADNDYVLVYCVDSKTSGKYEVVPATGENGEYLNYAEDLVKDGEHGVQWSDEETSTFVAVYPAKNSSISEDGVITTNISSVQNNVFEPIYGTDGTTVTGWKGKAFDNDANSPTMTNGIMFARTVASPKVTDENGNQTTTTNTVNLRFKPYSSVLKFDFAGYSTNTESSIKTIYVQKVELTAPVAVAGQFDLTVSKTGASAAVEACTTSSSTSTITLNTILPGGTYVPLQVGQSLEFDIFTIPSGDHKLTEAWTVKLTTDHGDFTYKLKPASTTENKLAAGKINKINVPSLNVVNTTPWDYSKWMTYIPTPVYLSELSVPGAWYCMDSGYQNTTDIATLYNAGIRAFNIDCRVTKKTSANDHSLLGRWGADDEWNDSNYTSNAYLACAGTEGNTGISIPYIGSAQNLEDGKYVADIITSICEIAQKNPKEYVVIVFTFAEKPKTVSDQYEYGSVRADYITEQLNTILSADAIKNYLYTNVTKNTTIEDVINSGKNVIVKINHSNVDFATSTSPSFTMPAGHMASFASMAMDGYIQTGVTNIISGLTTNSSPYYGYYAKIQSYPIYNGKATTDLTYYFHQAQNTSSDKTRGNTTFNAIPTLGQRMDAIDDIIKKSIEIYDASTHNAWFQLGIGGSINGSNQKGVSDVLNPYLQGVIEAKIEKDPSPVGIVLMNHATDANGHAIQLVKDIIEMNGKFYLKRKGGDIITGNEGDNDGGIDEGEGEEL